MARSLLCLLPILLAGCVERTVTIATEPSGAKVFLNDQEIGDSPVKVPFTWYGDYDVIVRKDGFETLKTHHRIDAPWYQWPFLDLFSECLVPFTIHDDHAMPVFVLQTRQAPDRQTVLENAEQTRRDATGS